MGGRADITIVLCFNTDHIFTGKERDAESGLDYFGARYYASTMGRWMSPDWAEKPEAVPYSQLDNPQSLNLYGYVNNNPLSHADADGHEQDPLTLDEAQRGNSVFVGALKGLWKLGAQTCASVVADGKSSVACAKAIGRLPSAIGEASHARW